MLTDVFVTSSIDRTLQNSKILKLTTYERRTNVVLSDVTECEQIGLVVGCLTYGIPMRVNNLVKIGVLVRRVCSRWYG